MGSEFRRKGVNMALGPVVGPMGRMVSDGRIWEGISVDPYLCGSLASYTVTGVQSSGVITSTKVCACVCLLIHHVVADIS
jgi:beta-glucosidase